MTKIEMLNIVEFSAKSHSSMQGKNLEPIVDSWFEFFGWMEPEVLKRFVMKAMMTSEFFPTIAAIVEAGRSLTAMTNKIPTADEAWQEVMDCVRKGKKPEWSHEYIGRAVKVIGYDNIRMSEKIGVERGQFFKVYDRLLERSADESINQAVLQIGGIQMNQLTDKIAKQIGDGK